MPELADPNVKCQFKGISLLLVPWFLFGGKCRSGSSGRPGSRWRKPSSSPWSLHRQSSGWWMVFSLAPFKGGWSPRHEGPWVGDRGRTECAGHSREAPGRAALRPAPPAPLPAVPERPLAPPRARPGPTSRERAGGGAGAGARARGRGQGGGAAELGARPGGQRCRSRRRRSAAATLRGRVGRGRRVAGAQR